MTRPRGECPECGYSIRLKGSVIGYHAIQVTTSQVAVRIVCVGSLQAPVTS